MIKLNPEKSNGSTFENKTKTSFHCDQKALIGNLGLFIQLLLASVAFFALVVKRFCEPKDTRRSWKIWFYDTSKQALGAALIHFANVFLASMFKGDPCTWYFISFLLDSTIGLLVIWICLKISNVIALKKNFDLLKFGEYGKPPKLKAWLWQTGVYLLIMLIEKILMTLLTFPAFWKHVREILTSPITNPKLELVIVMFIVPFIVNAIIFWVVDNFLKRSINKQNNDQLIIKYNGTENHNEESSDDDLIVRIDATKESYRLLNPAEI